MVRRFKLESWRLTGWQAVESGLTGFRVNCSHARYPSARSACRYCLLPVLRGYSTDTESDSNRVIESACHVRRGMY
eukprot:1876385-Rhodomonas_salina.1